MGAVSGSIALCEHVEYHYSFIVYIGTEGSVHVPDVLNKEV